MRRKNRKEEGSEGWGGSKGHSVRRGGSRMKKRKYKRERESERKGQEEKIQEDEDEENG